MNDFSPLFWACQKIHECLNSNVDNLDALNSYWITFWQADFAFTAKPYIISTCTAQNKSCNILFMMNYIYLSRYILYMFVILTHCPLHVSYTFNRGTLQARNQISRLVAGYHLGATIQSTSFPWDSRIMFTLWV